MAIQRLRVRDGNRHNDFSGVPHRGQRRERSDGI